MIHIPVFITSVTLNPVLDNVHHKNSCPFVTGIMQKYEFLCRKLNIEIVTYVNSCMRNEITVNVNSK